LVDCVRGDGRCLVVQGRDLVGVCECQGCEVGAIIWSSSCVAAPPAVLAWMR
jgi:hypothetical protein